MEEREIKKQLAQKIYVDIMKYDAELSALEALIDRLESQLAKFALNDAPGLRAALSEARVLANDNLTLRNKAIDNYDMIMKDVPGLGAIMFNELCQRLLDERTADKPKI